MRQTTLPRAVRWSVFSLLAFLLVDAAIFRSGWYYKYLEPNSTTGQLELQVFWLLHTLPDTLPEAAVIGDSRIAEGFSARKAGEAVADKIHFWNLGVPGASPRSWFYLLRDGDPSRTRVKALAIAIDSYSDQDGSDILAEHLADLSYSIGRLRIADCLDFAGSFPAGDRRGVLTGCFFKAITLRRDVQGLLSDPKQRLAKAKDWRNNGHGYIDGYSGKPEAMTGLAADFEKRTFPAEVPQTGQLTAYRKLWLGRILDLYKDSPTQVIFFELPRAPLPPPEPKVPPRFLQSVVNRQRLTILPQATFRDLEHPEVFADGLHLNHEGRAIFSARLGQKIAEVVAAN